MQTMRSIGQLCCALLCIALTGFSAEPRLIRTMDLTRSSGEQLGATSGHLRRIGGLQFSPDGQWVALFTMADAGSAASSGNNLILIPTDGNAARERIFPLPKTPVRTADAIHWSPDSDFVVVGSLAGPSAAVVRIDDGHICQVPEMVPVVGGFIGAGVWIGASPVRKSGSATGESPSSSVTVRRTDCSTLRQWPFRGYARKARASASAHVVAMWDKDNVIDLFDPVTGLPLRRLESPRRSDMMRFGENGKSICLGDTEAFAPLTCLDSRTGHVVARHEGIHGGAPFDVSLTSSVVVATDAKLHYNPFTERSRFESRFWIVWDYRTGTELAKMKVLRQKSDVDPTFGERGGNPWAIGIAPDGKTFAIAGDGTVRLYEVSQTPGRSDR